MSQPTHNRPMPVQAAPQAVDDELAPLLDWMARADAPTAAPLPALAAPRRNLLARVARLRETHTGIRTLRRGRQTAHRVAEGVTLTVLYETETGRRPRPGEPSRVCLVELAPGARVTRDAPLERAGLHREWLVMQGDVESDGQALSLRDYRVLPADGPLTTWHSSRGALLFLRESHIQAQPQDRPFTVLDAEAGWPEFAPGIRRRVLWQRDGQAAMLYHADPGAAIPVHRHDHDEECLMLQGSLYLDDKLLQAGDYQLAPAGTCHAITETDTGVVVYAHADLQMQFTG